MPDYSHEFSKVLVFFCSVSFILFICFSLYISLLFLSHPCFTESRITRSEMPPLFPPSATATQKIIGRERVGLGDNVWKIGISTCFSCFQKVTLYLLTTSLGSFGLKSKNKTGLIFWERPENLFKLPSAIA